MRKREREEKSYRRNEERKGKRRVGRRKTQRNIVPVYLLIL